MAWSVIAAVQPSAEDHLALLRVLSLYGHVVDANAWDDLDCVFTDDAVFDGSALGRPVWSGLQALRAEFRDARKPAAHHTTNPVVEAVSGDRATCLSKWHVVPVDARDPVRSGDYRDELVRTVRGWRIARRTAMQRSSPVPAEEM
jgi:SnoaL-like domain